MIYSVIDSLPSQEELKKVYKFHFNKVKKKLQKNTIIVSNQNDIQIQQLIFKGIDIDKLRINSNTS